MNRKANHPLGLILVGLATAAACAMDDRVPASGAGDFPLGWASAEGGTKGGQGGPTVTVSDTEAFLKAIQSKQPLIVQVSGTIHLARPERIQSNKTLLGLGADATIIGGVRMVRANDIVIRNIAFRGGPDAIDIEQSLHIWVDHCDLSACEDGLLDIKRGSDFVTVSWNHFHHHHKTCLVGHSDKPDIRRIDAGHLRATYHHNFFDATGTRHPRVRYAEPVHVFNN
jgi:pectate lyase